jgi:hypothetical protein
MIIVVVIAPMVKYLMKVRCLISIFAVAVNAGIIQTAAGTTMAGLNDMQVTHTPTPTPTLKNPQFPCQTPGLH